MDRNGLLILLFTYLTFASGNLVNKKVERIIDISSQVVKVTCRIQVTNEGQTKVDNYFFKIDQNSKGRLAHISATIASEGNEKEKNPLAVTKHSADGEDVWKISLANHGVAAAATSPMIEVRAVFTKVLTPYPTEISQGDKQLVLFDGNHYFLSPYLTQTQTTKVRLPTGSSIESYSKLKPNTQSSNIIDYGPYTDIAPNSYSKMQIHYENNSPFLVVNRLERNIEVSHWAGVVSVEEDVDVRHEGAALKGSFSRYDFQREPSNGRSAVKNFKTKLPHSARDVYYRDEIGNISTSNMRQTASSVVVDLRPRFPLFGGWKTHYILGYALPASDFLFNDGNQFVLRIPFVNHIFDNSVIEEATVKIVLPEGASNIDVKLPFSVTRERDQIKKTYLDTFGRIVIVLKKTNLVEDHIQDIEVHYTFSRFFMFQEPLLLVSFIFFLCFLVIVYSRLDFKISSSPLKNVSQRATSILLQIIKHQEAREAIYEGFDTSISKVRANKDVSFFQSTLKRLNADHKQETSTITSLAQKLKEEGGSRELLSKIEELQVLDRQLKDQLQSHVTFVEKSAKNPASKTAITDSDKKLNSAKQELATKMRAVTTTLIDVAYSS